MAANVHILATCRKPELEPFTELVFKTLRVGFPTLPVTAHINFDATVLCPSLAKLCKSVGAKTVRVDTIHHQWIEKLILSESEPFWIVDTDVVFYESFEEFTTRKALAGFRVPEWKDEFAGAVTRSRLHPSLLYIDPNLFKDQISGFSKCLPASSPFTPFHNPIYPVAIPLNGVMYFHDTMSLAYHAIGGEAFNDLAKNKYFHFNFGTLSDVVLPRLSEGECLMKARDAVLANPELGRGAWREQEEYYSRHPVLFQPIEDEIDPDESKAEAHAFAQEVCKGRADALQFCHLWYRYCHGIDDLVDTMLDGRPKTSAEGILALFAQAAIIYNCPFFVANRNHLFPLVLSITNTFANSVAWERSPMAHRRVMADTLRMCGDEMFFLVAMIVGGWDHMRSLSDKIRERDWLLQHDQKGNPK
jgi:hypothetical protein